MRGRECPASSRDGSGVPRKERHGFRRGLIGPCAHRHDHHYPRVVARERNRVRRGLPRSEPLGDRIAGVAVLSLVGLAVLCAVVLAAGSFVSYASVKAHLDAFASDGDADLTQAAFDSAVLRARLAAAGAMLLAAALFVARRRLRDPLGELLAAAALSAGELRRTLHAALASESRVHLAALGLVTLVALALRLEFLFQPMRYDEAVTYVHYASEPWYIALSTYTAPNNHVLHSLLVHVTTFVLGSDPWAIRLPALAAGVVLVPASYVAARLLYGRQAALLAAALVACSSPLVEYSTNARGYTLLALFFIVLVAIVTRLRHSGNPAEWVAFAVLAALGFLTVPVMLYAFAGVVAWLAAELWRERRDLLARRLVPAVLATSVLTVVLYSPILATSGLGALVSNEFVRSLPWNTFPSELRDSLASLFDMWHRDIPLVLQVLLVVSFVVAIVLHGRIGRTAVPPAVPIMAAIGILLVAQRVAPFERVWLFLVPLYLATAAAGALFLARPLAQRVGGEGSVAVVATVVATVWLAAAAVSSQAVYRSEDTSTFRAGPDVASLLERELRPGDKLLVAPPADAVLEYELERRGLVPAELLYWRDPGSTERFLAVVKEGPDDYPLAHLLADPRLEETLTEERVLEAFEEATVYELRPAR